MWLEVGSSTFSRWEISIEYSSGYVLVWFDQVHGSCSVPFQVLFLRVTILVSYVVLAKPLLDLTLCYLPHSSDLILKLKGLATLYRDHLYCSDHTAIHYHGRYCLIRHPTIIPWNQEQLFRAHVYEVYADNCSVISWFLLNTLYLVVVPPDTATQFHPQD